MYLIGHSIDIHKLQECERNILQKIGGIYIDSKYKIIAHSDGDIIIHAIINAILGALSLGDIGEYFPDDDPKNKNIDSIIMLKKIINIMNNKKYKIKNIDLTIISEHIIFKNIKKDIKENLIKLLNLENISLKATRWEENKKMIECHCSLLLIKLNNY